MTVSFMRTPFSSISCVMDLISMVLGMRSSEVGCTDFRLILDLKRVLIKVDFPRPLCPTTMMLNSKPCFMAFLRICSRMESIPT